jgi:hypothetical protein
MSRPRHSPKPKYAWEKAVNDVFIETNPKELATKLNLAEHAIAERLCDRSPVDLDESIALRTELRSLLLLFRSIPQPGLHRRNKFKAA